MAFNSMIGMGVSINHKIAFEESSRFRLRTVPPQFLLNVPSVHFAGCSALRDS
jgi:hypothetical protein